MRTFLVVVAAWLLAACPSKDEGKKPGLEPPPDPAPGPGPKQAPEGGGENLPPEIVSVTAEASAVAATGSTVLTVKVMDPENDPYHVWWDADCGVVAPSGDDPSRAIFLAPDEPGACTVSVKVQDADMVRTIEYAYQVVVTRPEELEVVQ